MRLLLWSKEVGRKECLKKNVKENSIGLDVLSIEAWKFVGKRGTVHYLYYATSKRMLDE